MKPGGDIMIQWEITSNKLPVKAWCIDRDEGTVRQTENLANHPALRERVCLMPDAHLGKGTPIGGVIAYENALIPNAVGVDIGCGMGQYGRALTLVCLHRRTSFVKSSRLSRPQSLWGKATREKRSAIGKVFRRGRRAFPKRPLVKSKVSQP
jgi:hypothetical protein